MAESWMSQSIAIKISRGFSLVPALLGITYHLMDTFVANEILSAGYHTVQTSLNFVVIQFFLCEQNPNLLCARNPVSTLNNKFEDLWDLEVGFVNKYPYTSSWVSRKKNQSHKLLSELFDDFSEFVWHPYVEPSAPFTLLLLCAALDREGPNNETIIVGVDDFITMKAATCVSACHRDNTRNNSEDTKC